MSNPTKVRICDPAVYEAAVDETQLFMASWHARHPANEDCGLLMTAFIASAAHYFAAQIVDSDVVPLDVIDALRDRMLVAAIDYQKEFERRA